MENSGVLVRPMTMAPAFFRLVTTGASAGAIRFLESSDAICVRQALLIGVDLDGNRHALHRAGGGTIGKPPVGGGGIGQGLIAQIDDHGVQMAIGFTHPFHGGGDSICTA